MSARYQITTRSKFALLFGASAGALICATPALAQDVTPPTDDQEQAAENPLPPESAPAESEVGDPTGDTIVVTGSRIRNLPDFTSADPVTTIDPSMSAKEGKLDTAAMLQSSPIAAGSTQITSALSSNFVTNGGPGAQTLDLRGLGAERTLVLLNGRRAGPAGTRGSVASFDLNVLPQTIVQRVDILKTGASSIYGSDAVAGVVNLITKTDTDGIELDAMTVLPFDSGGEQFRIGATWGKTFDRGHVMVSVDYYKQKELARGDRSYLDCPEAYVFQPGTRNRADLVDPRTGKFHCEDLRWGHVWTYDYEYNYLGTGTGNLGLPDGTGLGQFGTILFQYQYPGETLGLPPNVTPPGALTNFVAPAGWFPTGYDPASIAVQNAIHPFVLEQTINPKTERYTLYGDASYELTDHVEAFAEFLGNRRKTYQNGWRQIWTFGGTEDVFGTYWAQGWEGLNFLSPTAITNHADTSQKVDYWRGVGGLRGDFGGLFPGWAFDTYVQYSHSKGIYRSEQFLQEIYDVTSFQTASCVGTTLPISGKQCMDIPWTDPFFLRGELSPQLADYMFDWEEGRTIFKQLSGEGSVTGDLIELPAGPLGVALGVAMRGDEINDLPGEITLAGNSWGNTASGLTAGSSTTTEAFGEVHVPVLKDQSFAKDLSFTGAARITSVEFERKDGVTDSDKGNWTYKIGGNWALNDWLRFRGTYGTSFRAPALFELFLANETSFPSQRTIDPCFNWGQALLNGSITQRQADNCASEGIPDNHGGSITATAFAQGGLGVLESETSKAKTASIILTPHFSALPNTRIALALDWFNIEVNGEITQLGARNILYRCYDSESFPNDPLCSLFTRGINVDEFSVNQVFDKFINIASQENRGFDFTANIRQNLGARWGSLNFLAQTTFQTKDTQALFADDVENLNGEAGSPKFVGDFNLTWTPPGGWTVFYGLDVFGKSSDETDYIEANGSLCQDRNEEDPVNGDTLRPDYCVDMTVPRVMYHHASVTKEFGDKMTLTAGISNIFDKKPPKISTLQGQVGLLGPAVATSQYDFMGRRVFFNISRRF